jgi:hypothetical protein
MRKTPDLPFETAAFCGFFRAHRWKSRVAQEAKLGFYKTGGGSAIAVAKPQFFLTKYSIRFRNSSHVVRG